MISKTLTGITILAVLFLQPETLTAMLYELAGIAAMAWFIYCFRLAEKQWNEKNNINNDFKQ